ncbi:hypothetical protein Cus16_1038 [Curtobacterium sp. ER1/6]|nr:hypothetical protein Cus16_1038 [Curtobacterium sp. ER1/6]
MLRGTPLRARRLARVALGDVPQRVVDRGERVGVERDARGLDVVRDLLGSRRPDDRGGHVRVLQRPRDRELCERQAGLVGDGLQALDGLEDLVAHEPLDHVRAALLVRGARALGCRLARLVLAGEDSLRDRRPDDLAEAELLRGGDDLTLDDAPQHRVLRLVRDELEAELLREGGTRADLLGVPLADADVQRLALPDDVGEGLHRLLEGRLVVVAVRLVEVDVVGLQALERPVDRLRDVLPAEADVVVALRTGRPVDLREDLERLAALGLERLAEDGLGGGVGVRVGGVERGDARVERCPHALGGDVVLDLRAVRQPVAVGDLGDLESGVAQVPEFHGSDASPARGGVRGRGSTWVGVGCGVRWGAQAPLSGRRAGGPGVRSPDARAGWTGAPRPPSRARSARPASPPAHHPHPHPASSRSTALRPAGRSLHTAPRPTALHSSGRHPPPTIPVPAPCLHGLRSRLPRPAPRTPLPRPRGAPARRLRRSPPFAALVPPLPRHPVLDPAGQPRGACTGRRTPPPTRPGVQSHDGSSSARDPAATTPRTRPAHPRHHDRHGPGHPRPRDGRTPEPARPSVGRALRHDADRRSREHLRHARAGAHGRRTRRGR